MKLCQMVDKASKMRLLPVVGHKKIILYVPMDINLEFSIFGTKYFPPYHRPYLENCRIKVHKTLPNGRVDIYKEVSSGGFTQINYPPCVHGLDLTALLFHVYFIFPPIIVHISSSAWWKCTKLCQIVEIASKKRLVTVVARRNIISYVFMDKNPRPLYSIN
jgi:hypothetical protein